MLNLVPMRAFSIRLAFFIGIIILTAAGLQAQDGVPTRKVTQYFKTDSNKIEYVFYVLDSEPYNVKHGKYTWFYDNGRKKAVTQYVHGIPNGKFTTYHRTGARRSTGTFKDGVIDGHCTNFYSSGKVENEGDYVGGRRHGKWKYYSSSGRVSRTVEYNYGNEIKPNNN